jgi:CubicO group peptidase (beta-lactamase class C family)
MNPEVLERLITEQMQAHQVPGLSIALLNPGDVIYERGFGITSVEADAALPVTVETIFRAGSVTKSLTATMLMRLVEDGLLNLDIPVCDYDATLKFSDRKAAQQVTLRMLLSHTTGLPSDLEYHDRRTSRTYPTDLAQYAAERLPNYRFIAPPGTGFHYSNIGINLAARLGEIVTGKAYPQLMHDYVFEPLGMSRTMFDPLTAMTYPLALGHMREADGTIQVKRPFIDQPMEYPCGFVLTTIRDLAIFALAHLGGGRLSSAVTETMHQMQADRHNGEGYGLGFRLRDYRGQGFVGHNGAIGKYGAALAMLPDAGCGVVMLFNRAPGFWTAARQITETALDLLLGEDVLPVSVPLDETSVDYTRHVGRYLSYDLGLIEIEANEVRINGAVVTSPAIAQLDDRYFMINGALAERYNAPLARVDAETLSRYAGLYDADIDRWIVRVNGDGLLVYSDDDRVEVKAIVLTKTRFASDFGILDFEQDKDTGQGVSLVSALGYRFQRTMSLMD